MSDEILYEGSGGIAWITLNRPAALNALDEPLARAACLPEPSASLAIARGAAGTLAAALEFEAASQGNLTRTTDRREGVAAFLGKCEPRFTGR